MKTTERYAHLSPDHLAGVKDIIKPRIENYADVIDAFSPEAKKPSLPIHGKIETLFESVV